DCRELFPPLTDIAASDVSFDGSNCKVLSTAATVQDAIDILCDSQQGACTLVAQPNRSVQAVFDAIGPGQDAEVCFPVGVYQLKASVNIVGKGNLKIVGAGLGTRLIAAQSEAALIFKNCASVTIRDLYAEAGVAARTQFVTNAGNTALKTLGAITIVDCKAVE